MTENLDNLVKFLKFINKFKRVKRTVFIAGEKSQISLQNMILFHNGKLI